MHGPLNVKFKNLYVGTKEDYKEFRTACLCAKNRKVTIVKKDVTVQPLESAAG
jgi:hypothetical protein